MNISKNKITETDVKKKLINRIESLKRRLSIDKESKYSLFMKLTKIF